jgi:6-phosphogluconolactonase
MRGPGRAWLVVVTATALAFSNACGSPSATHLAYVAAGENILAYRINNKSGTAQALIGSPFVAGTTPSSVVVHPSNRFVFVANQGDSTISLFKIDSTSGALTEVLPRTATGFSPAAMTLDSGGTFLFVANLVPGSISVFSVGAGGTLSPLSGSPVPLAGSPGGLTLTPAGDLLFVPVPAFSAIYTFTVSSGVLTSAGAPVFVSGGISTLAVDPGGKFLYAPNPTTNTVTAFNIQSGGSLTPVPGSPFAAGTTATTLPVAAAVNPAGTFLFVANSGSASVSQFQIDSTGALKIFTTPSQSAGTTPRFITIDPDSKFVYVGNQGAKSISELSFNTDGSLATTSNTISLGASPRSLSLTK